MNRAYAKLAYNILKYLISRARKIVLCLVHMHSPF